MKTEKNPIREILDRLSPNLNLVYKGETASICYSLGFSGDVVIIPNNGEPIKLHSKDLIEFFAQVGGTYSKNTVLMGENIVQHLTNLNLLEHQKKNYFRNNSKLWKAIFEHIYYAKKCVLIDRDESKYGEAVEIISYRGSGAAINLKNVEIRGIYQPNEKPFLSFTFEIEYGGECFSNYSKTYSIDIDTDLEINFTKEKFDNYIQQLKNTKEEKNKQNDLYMLDMLVRKYPEQAEKYVKIECGV